MALDGRRARFVDEYLLDLNATRAAIRAGYSARTAQEQGSRLLSNVMVAEEIARRTQTASQRALVTAEEVLRGLHEEATRTGKGSSHGARVAAWAHLGKYHGLFTDKIEASVTADVTVSDARSKLQSLLLRQSAAGPAGGSAGDADG